MTVSAAWNVNGKTQYGFSNNRTNFMYFFCGFNEQLFSHDCEALVFNKPTERFYNAVEALSQIEVAKPQIFRDLSFEYGILPYPKLDEAQEMYYSNSYAGATAMFIPVTNKDPEKAGHVIDAMSYEGEKAVIPAYREVTVEQKGLRNDDSIEMLEIIMNSVVPLYYSVFSIGNQLFTDLVPAVWEKTARQPLPLLPQNVHQDRS